MNKIAISLALVAVCVGVVAANKFGHRNKLQVHDDNDYTLETGHLSHNPRHHQKHEASSCEELCNYHHEGKHGHNHGHGHGHGHGHNHGHGHSHGHGHGHGHGSGHGSGHGHGLGHGHGQGYGHGYGHRNGHGHRHRNDHTSHGSSGEVDFYPGDSHFYNDHSGKGASHNGGSSDSGSHSGGSSESGSHNSGSGDFDFNHGGSGDDDSDSGHHHHHGLHKHIVKPTRQGKRHGSRRSEHDLGGHKTRKDEFQVVGPESSTKASDRKSVEAHKGFLAGEKTAFDAGVTHRDGEEKESFHKHQTLNKDKTFFRDRSTGVNNVDAFRTSNENSDSGHISGENIKFIGAAAGASANEDKEFEQHFTGGRGNAVRTSED